MLTWAGVATDDELAGVAEMRWFVSTSAVAKLLAVPVETESTWYSPNADHVIPTEANEDADDAGVANMARLLLSAAVCHVEADEAVEAISAAA